MEINDSHRLNLILGVPIHTSQEGIKIKQFTLREVSSIGYENYLSHVGLITTSVDDFLKILMDTPVYMELYMRKHELRPLDFLLMFSEDSSYKKMVEESIEFVLGLERGQIEIENFSNRVLFNERKDLSSSDDTKLIEINNELFDEIITLVKLSNGMMSATSDGEANPHDDRAKEIYEKMKKNREKVQKIKALESDEKPRGLHDIISAVTVKSPSTNKINILDYTLFQIYDEYSRLYAIENYHLSTKSMMFGGDSEIADWAKPQ